MGNPRALTEWQKEIDSYLIGTTRLQGFVTPKQFLLVFNRYHEQKLLKSELMKYANKLVRQSRQELSLVQLRQSSRSLKPRRANRAEYFKRTDKHSQAYERADFICFGQIS